MKKIVRLISFVLFAVFSLNMTVYGNQPTSCISFSNEHTDYQTPEKSSVSNNDASSYLTLIDENNLLEESVKNNIIKVFNEVYFNVFDYYNDGEYVNVTIEVTEIYSNPAYTVGHTICIDYTYLNNNPEDYDVITHELIHVAQYNIQSAIPIWLIEGMADYGRYKFGINNEAANWQFEAPNYAQYFTDAYKTTAAFLVWIEKEYPSFTVKNMNKIMKEGKYSNNYIKEVVGYSFDDLWIQYLAAHNISVDDIDISLPPTSSIPTDTDIMSYLKIENVNNCANNEMINNIKTVFENTYAGICTHFNNGQLLPLTVVFEPENGNLAYTDCANGKIVINSQYLVDNPEDYDCFTHELIHFAQNYSGSNQPIWLVEGIADYGRNIYGQNNFNAGWGIPFYSANIYSGYTDTSAFLYWAEEKYNANLVRILNNLLKNDTYTPVVWKKITGHSLSELEELYYKNNPHNLTTPGDVISNVCYKNEKNHDVYLYDYSSYTVMIYGNWDQSNIKYNMDFAIDLKKELGNKINIIYVFANQSRNNFIKHLSDLGYTPNDYKDIIILQDINFKSTEFTFKIVKGAYLELSWPGYALINPQHQVIYSSILGATDEYKVSEYGDNYSHLLYMLNILSKIFPEHKYTLTDYWGKTIAKTGTVIKTSETDNYNPDIPDGTYTVTSDSMDKPTVRYNGTISNITNATYVPDSIIYKNVVYYVTSVSATTFSSKQFKAKFKVLNNSYPNPTIEYVAPTKNNYRSITIPDYVIYKSIQYKVVSVGKNAFKNNKKLKHVDLGDTIYKINANAFYGCTSLTDIQLKNNLQTIGNGAFNRCKSLPQIDIPKNVTKIGAKAFYGCNSLSKINIKSKKLTYVGKNALKGIYKKCKIFVPKSKYKAYNKLLKNKGQKKSVKIRKS